MRLCAAHIEASLRAIQGVRGAVLLALAAVLLSCVPGSAFATYADYDEDNAAAQDIGAYGDVMYASDIPDGVYEVDARTSSSMCIMYRTYEDASKKVSKEKCYVQVKDGKMTARFYLSNMYTRLYIGGTAKDAAGLTDDDGADDSAYIAGDPAEGYVPHYYEVDIPALNYLITFASFAGGNYSYSSDPKSTWYTRAKWYSRSVVFMPNKNTLAAIEEAGKDSSGSKEDNGGQDGGSESGAGDAGAAGGPSDGSSSASSAGESSDGDAGGGADDGATTDAGTSNGAENGSQDDGSSAGDGNDGDDNGGGDDGDDDDGDDESDDDDSDDEGDSSGGSVGSGSPGDAQGGSGSEQQDSDGSEGAEGDGAGAQAAGTGSGNSMRGIAIKPAGLELSSSDEEQGEQAEVLDEAPVAALSPQQAIALLAGGLALCGLGAQVASFAIARRPRVPRSP